MSRKILVARVAAVLTVVLGIALAGFVPAHAAGVTASFVKQQAWETGYTGQITLKNDTASQVTGWKVEFDLPASTTVGAYWDALQTNAGGHYVFTNREYNGNLAPGASATFGFNAAGTAAPVNCRINGSPCDGGSTNPTTTTTSTTSRTTTSTSTTTTTTTTGPPPAGNKLLVGYLHSSFANGSGYIRMADVPAEWDIIQLAFAEPTSVTSGDLRFKLCPVAECPNVESEAEFTAAIRAKQAQGKKVLISIGGQNGQVQLTSTAARDAFVSSVSAIIDRYGLNGLDIDFEGHSLYLDSGDTDFKAPKTSVVVNLISALKTLKAKYGSGFQLTMAPETFFVQLGYQHYGGSGGADNRAGSYLPVIHAMRNDLTLLHVQQYNSGPIMGLDNQWKQMPSVDFHVAMADMVLGGFPVKGDVNNQFPALRQDQIALGLPASPNAGNGHTAVAAVHKVLDCLMKGSNCESYKPRAKYPSLRGLMTWSINWDRFNNAEFSKNHRAYLDR
ncbi:chitinase [Crossiella cryophila]|uniref:chitinase n=1 Tax=Crossiella cryophila TaxID=43355 RepID=A0A7W7C5U5_9PSEU|nr:cellulose binding domain-containing protein [Crossiella cryophila]MBB4675056.1 chitinase [Crossiella cryophila]